MTRTRIVATYGPASADDRTLAGLLDAGVDVFRLNFSHGTHEEHGRAVRQIRAAAGERPVALLQDLCGPKLRLDRPISGGRGDVVELPLPESVRLGDPVLLADGAMQLEVIDPRRSRILVGGAVPAGKGINLPSSRLDFPALTEKDRRDLEFGLAQGVDYVALSFVREASDLEEVKRSGLPVIAKIEKAQAVENMESILAAADGLMVARGDLGVEIPIERVPLVQKRLIAAANRHGKPVITATQMLRSMVDHKIPTRAEATDVANAVLDGTDAVMLSEESAIGRHPVEAVRVMGRILKEAEPAVAGRPLDECSDPTDALSQAACEVAERIGAKAIVVPTQSGYTAQKIARFRPPRLIIALTPSRETWRRLSLVWGVTALKVDHLFGAREVLETFREPVRASGLVDPGDPLVVTAGWPFAQPGITNLIHVSTA